MEPALGQESGVSYRFSQLGAQQAILIHDILKFKGTSRIRKGSDVSGLRVLGGFLAGLGFRLKIPSDRGVYWVGHRLPGKLK